MAGAIEASITPENADPDIQYADDVEFDVLYLDPELSFKTKMADLPLAIQELIFDNKIDDNGVLVRTSTDKPPYFAVGFKSEKSNHTYRYVWLYKVRANIIPTFTGTAFAACYLVGTLNGSTFTPATDFLTSTVPTAEDGYTYISLGILASAYQLCLYPEHPMYRFVDGAFKSLGQVAYEAHMSVGELQTELATAIEQTDAAIALKADKTVTDSLGNRLQTAEASLTTQAGQISAVVSQSQTTTNNLNNLTIGGRNYVRNSNNTVELNNTGDTFISAWMVPAPIMSDDFVQDCKGKSIVVSYYAMCENLERSSSGGWIGIQISYYTETEGVYAYTSMTVTSVLDSGTKPWARYRLTTSIPSNAVSVRSTMLTIQNCKGLVRLRYPQVECGNRITDYRPAPEDLELRMTTSGDPYEAMSFEQLRALAREGFDIQSHTWSHARSCFNSEANQNASDADIDLEYRLADEAFRVNGFDYNCMVFPWGAHEARHLALARRYARFGVNCRGTDGQNDGLGDPMDLNRLSAATNGGNLAQLKAAIDTAIQRKGWLIILTHAGAMQPDATSLDELLTYAQSKGVRIENFREAARLKAPAYYAGQGDTAFRVMPDGRTIFSIANEALSTLIARAYELGYISPMANAIDSLTASWTGGVLYAGEEIDKSMISVTAQLHNGNTRTITDFTVEGTLTATEGDNILTVRYGTLSGTLNVTGLANDSPATTLLAEHTTRFSGASERDRVWFARHMEAGTYALHIILSAPMGAGASTNNALILKTASVFGESTGAELFSAQAGCGMLSVACRWIKRRKVTAPLMTSFCPTRYCTCRAS